MEIKNYIICLFTVKLNKPLKHFNKSILKVAFDLLWPGRIGCLLFIDK
jgi:hypothetical protein